MPTNALNSSAEMRKDVGKELTPEERKQFLWAQEIKNSQKLFRDWFSQFDQVQKRYRDERGETYSPDQSNQVRRYNALWSITQTLLPNLYSELPQPFFGRKFSDADPVGRDAAMILERAVTAELEGDELADACEDATLDYALGGRGVVWLKYGADFDLRESEEKTRLAKDDKPPRDEEVREDDEGSYYHAKYEKKIGERIDWEQVALKSFLHGPAVKWRHVPWVARLVPMTRDELVKRFKDVGKEVPLTITGQSKKNADKAGQEAEGLFARAEVWEIWDRINRVVTWMSPDYIESVLDEKKDILSLCGFFPCPKPAYGTMTNDRLDPVPNYMEWQDIATELDDVTFRIKLLTEALRVVGVYNSELGSEIKKVLSGKENDLIPVDNWAMFGEKGGFAGNIDWFPIEQVAKVLETLIKQRGVLVQELYEVTGVSDIVRGTSDPRDTATAQQIKGQFASQRLKRSQKQIARMIREAFVLMAEVIAEHYDDRTIMLQSGAQQFLLDARNQFDQARWDAAIALIRSDNMRRFRIKLDTETLGADEWNKGTEEVQMFLQSTGQLLQQAIPLAQSVPALVAVAKDLVMLGVRRLRAGRAVEASIERGLEQLVQEAKNAPPPQAAAPKAGKSPEEIAILQKQADTDQQRVGVERQRILIDEKRGEREHSLKIRKMDQDGQLKVMDIQSRERIAQANNAARQMQEQQRASAETQRDHMNRQDVQEQRAHDAASQERDRQFNRQDAMESRAHESMQADASRQHEVRQAQDDRIHQEVSSETELAHVASQADLDRKEQRRARASADAAA